MGEILKECLPWHYYMPFWHLFSSQIVNSVVPILLEIYFFSQSINFSSVVLCYASVLLLLVKVKGLDSFWLIYIVTHCSNYQSYSKKFLCNFRVRESHSLPKLRLIVLIVLCPYMQTYETRRVSCFMYVCTQKIYKKALKV